MQQGGSGSFTQILLSAEQRKLPLMTCPPKKVGTSKSKEKNRREIICKYFVIRTMKEPGEQCTVVFALIVTEPEPLQLITAKTIVHFSLVLEFLNNLWGLGTE